MVSPIVSAHAERRDFIITSNAEKSFVEINASHTLGDVRQIIGDELDDEQLPASEWSFKVNGIRLSAKQESRKNAFDLIDAGSRVELVKKKMKRKPDGVENNTSSSVKRMKLSNGTVTPFEPSLGSDKPAEPENNDDHKQGAEGAPLRPTYLDSKLVAGPPTRKDDPANDTGFDSDATVDLMGEPKESRGGSSEPAVSKPSTTQDEIRQEDFITTYLPGFGNRRRDDDEEESRSIKGAETTSKRDDPTDDIPMTEAAEGRKQPFSEDLELDDLGLSIGKKRKAVDSLDIDDEEEILEVNEEVAVDPHKELDEATSKSRQVLLELTDILKNNPDFCSDTRRVGWLDDIRALEKKSSPQTVFGVLGNTGVGKSSLLNALLDEASVLPTSGSRGCTAAVVELVFNSDLVADENNSELGTQTVPVYGGEVEFIRLEDWQKELRLLVEECSTQEKQVYARTPDADRQPDAAAAWQKIDQVYGKGCMERNCLRSSDSVYLDLANNRRVKQLLTATVPGQSYNSIIVRSGEVDPMSEEAKELLRGHSQRKSKTKSKLKRLAQDFRRQINSYVYRSGNGDSPQTWPLIRKVELKGPWSVLSTGAVLVDLPGVRDSNAARAKVAETYLQNCNQIAIVAPIKRAVDDGTAKELMGEQFKRRLLMDGQYGSVFFVCTQTDDIEATETMRDHADVAQTVPGRWEKMNEITDSISGLEDELNPYLQKEEELEGAVDDAQQNYKDSIDDLKQAEDEMDEGEAYASDEEDDESLVEGLKAVVATNKDACIQARKNLAEWREENATIMETNQAKCSRLQKKLKSLCSTVRSEYSKGCLQADFRSGLKELYRKDDDDDDGTGANSQQQKALPDDFDMDVFCISANDYLKVSKIKAARDGNSNCFSNITDTQIPQLRQFVHQRTAQFCKANVKSFVESTKDVLDQMKLLASDVDDVPSGRSAFRMKNQFENKMRDLDKSIRPLADQFKSVIDQKVRQSLTSSLKNGASKGSAQAASIVDSWGSKSRRSNGERRPDKNGLYWSTYNAVTRREGVYTSGTAGAVDLNQELIDPMEKEMSTEWQSVLDSTIKRLLNDAERKILQLSTSTITAFAQELQSSGLDTARITSMLNTANRSATTALKTSFRDMAGVATNSQRDLSRELLPSIKEKMRPTYTNVQSVPRGSGTFDRMKSAMSSSCNHVVHSMFDDATRTLLSGITNLINQMKSMIGQSGEIVQKNSAVVFSICWDDTESKKMISPEMAKQIRECRDSLLPSLNTLVGIQNEACDLLGIEREEIELDVMGVETFDQQLARRKEEAKLNGDFFDMCDSDSELNIEPKKGVYVKNEKFTRGATSAAKTQEAEVIDLCDSDDDEYDKKPAAKPSIQYSAVKEESEI